MLVIEHITRIRIQLPISCSERELFAPSRSVSRRPGLAAGPRATAGKAEQPNVLHCELLKHRSQLGAVKSACGGAEVKKGSSRELSAFLLRNRLATISVRTILSGDRTIGIRCIMITEAATGRSGTDKN
jgi:hypothetical protein